MSDRLMIPGLRHTRAGMDEAAFLAQIDVHGGWPVGYKFVGFEHTSERAAGFCNSQHNDGWWTIIHSADDYYMWKLSANAWQRIADGIVSSIRLPRVDVARALIKDSRGYNATRVKATGGSQ